MEPAENFCRSPPRNWRRRKVTKLADFSAVCFVEPTLDSVSDMFPRDPRRGSFFDLSDRTKLRLTGADRLRFINGQITNDIGKASDSSAIAACVLNAKGKLNALVFVSLREILFLEATSCEMLVPRLDRYIIADDVQMEDVSANLHYFT